MSSFRIIQGGMGVAVSNWRLARSVSQLGQLGVVSGTGLAVVLSRRLQRGDPGGHMRRAMAAFPYPAIAERVLDRYFVEGGKDPARPFKLPAMPQIQPPRSQVELTVLANFVEVWLGKEGHDGVVGVNYLEKVQMATLPSLFGAMLAGVDYVLMGAGVPRQIPGVLDLFAEGRPATLRVDVEADHHGEPCDSLFDPAEFCGGQAPQLKRPKMLVIVASTTLASALARKATGRVDGFVVEGHVAGGHNAPPRGDYPTNGRGEPVYGDRDIVSLKAIKKLGLPFWLAGGFSSPEKLQEALDAGAEGVQVGTAFAFCEESGIDAALKQQVIEISRSGLADIKTDALASPTGFPFKVLQVPNTLSDQNIYEQRTRVCDLGYLRRAYRKEDGRIGYRCPAEPVDQYVAKGGKVQDTVGRKCICNALFAVCGLAQAGTTQGTEPPLMTCGNSVTQVAQFVSDDKTSYTAREVVAYLLTDSLTGSLTD